MPTVCMLWIRTGPRTSNVQPSLFLPGPGGGLSDCWHTLNGANLGVVRFGVPSLPSQRSGRNRLLVSPASAFAVSLTAWQPTRTPRPQITTHFLSSHPILGQPSVFLLQFMLEHKCRWTFTYSDSVARCDQKKKKKKEKSSMHSVQKRTQLKVYTMPLHFRQFFFAWGGGDSWWPLSFLSWWSLVLFDQFCMASIKCSLISVVLPCMFSVLFTLYVFWFFSAQRTTGTACLQTGAGSRPLWVSYGNSQASFY
jgi:hypothetical protein